MEKNRGRKSRDTVPLNTTRDVISTVPDRNCVINPAFPDMSPAHCVGQDRTRKNLALGGGEAVAVN